MTSRAQSPAPKPGEAENRDEKQRALLRTQDWALVLKQLTAIAFKRIRERSLGDAKDLAQSAIATAYQSIDEGGWDPQRAPLMSFLVASVISSAGNERRRKRNTCEVSLDEEEDEESESGRYEKYLASGEPPPDQVLDRLRYACAFEERLLARIADDELPMQLVTLMREGIATPRDLVTATGRSEEEVGDARRRLQYHAREVTKEMSAEDDLSGSKVTK